MWGRFGQRQDQAEQCQYYVREKEKNRPKWLCYTEFAVKHLPHRGTELDSFSKQQADIEIDIDIEWGCTSTS